MSKKKRIALRIMIFCIAGAVLLLWLAFDELADRKESADYYADLRDVHAVETAYVQADAQPAETDAGEDVTKPDAASDEAPETSETNDISAMDFEALSADMPDICGWITIPGTEVDFPVVQGEDNVFYLEHLPDGTANSSGSIMLDAANSADWTDDVSILHGHHMRGGKMFGSLSDFADADFAGMHPSMLLYTPQGDYDVFIIAACVVDPDEFSYCTDFSSEDEFNEYISVLTEASAYKPGILPTMDDRLILLSTCDYEFDNARFVILGMLAER